MCWTIKVSEYTRRAGEGAKCAVYDGVVDWCSGEGEVVGDWSMEGCQVLTYNVTHTHCQCRHLTHFGILMAVTTTQVCIDY